MAERDIIDLMKRNPHRWFSSEEIGSLTNTSSRITRNNLSNLTRFGVLTLNIQNKVRRWKLG